MDELLRLNDLVATPKALSYGTVYPLPRCLTSDAHTGGACLLEFPSGAVAYRCLHDSCQGKDWAYLREHNVITLPAGEKVGGSAGGPPNHVNHANYSPPAGAPIEKTSLPCQTFRTPRPPPGLYPPLPYYIADRALKARLIPRTPSHLWGSARSHDGTLSQ
jgi:hypothetical protein